MKHTYDVVPPKSTPPCAVCVGPAMDFRRAKDIVRDCLNLEEPYQYTCLKFWNHQAHVELTRLYERRCISQATHEQVLDCLEIAKECLAENDDTCARDSLENAAAILALHDVEDRWWLRTQMR